MMCCVTETSWIAYHTASSRESVIQWESKRVKVEIGRFQLVERHIKRANDKVKLINKLINSSIECFLP